MTILEALTFRPQNKRILAEKLETTTRQVELDVQEARLRGVAILSDSDGYRLAKNAAEARQCSERLRKRAITQLETAQALARAADNMEKAGRQDTLWAA